jgi:hypothetical protein
LVPIDRPKKKELRREEPHAAQREDVLGGLVAAPAVEYQRKRPDRKLSKTQNLKGPSLLAKERQQREIRSDDQNPNGR